MKTAVGLITTMIITAMVATGASAEWRLYVNRDNKAWSLERAYVSNDDCDRAARTLYRSGQALGVGCAEYPSPSAAQAPTPRPAEYARPNPTTRSVARADEPARVSMSRSSGPRVAEYSTRATSRQLAVAERAPDPAAATASIPRRLFFRRAAAWRSDRRKRRPGPSSPVGRYGTAASGRAPTVQRPPDDAAAIALAKAATEATAAAEREVAAEAVEREEAVTADKAERRTQLAIVRGNRARRHDGSCVQRASSGADESAPRAGPLLDRTRRADVGARVPCRRAVEPPQNFQPGRPVMAARAVRGHRGRGYRRRRASAGSHAEVHASEGRAQAVGAGRADQTRRACETGEPGKPGEPVRPLTPVRPLDGPAPVASVEPAKPASTPTPVGGGFLADRLVP